MKRRHLLTLTLVLLGLAGVAGGIWWQQREPAPLEFSDIPGINVISPAVELPEFRLQDHTGAVLNRASLQGHWTVAFFGFTHCPDICPTTLTNLRQAAKELESLPRPPRYLFVSLDPQRDTPAALKTYVEHFGPDITGATGPRAELDRLAERVGVIYEFEGDTSGDDYLVNHYAALLVFDPRGRLRAHILPPHQPARVVTVLKRLMDYYGA